MGLKYGMCRKCACYAHSCGLCQRYPESRTFSSTHGCWEFIALEPTDALDTDIELMKITPRTRTILRRLKVKTVRDITIFGREQIGFNGVPDKAAIKDILRAFEELGVSW